MAWLIVPISASLLALGNEPDMGKVIAALAALAGLIILSAMLMGFVLWVGNWSRRYSGGARPREPLREKTKSKEEDWWKKPLVDPPGEEE